MNLSNYFEPVDGSQIHFDNNFSKNLTDVLDDINENFQRIVAAPFFQGPEGKSVIKDDFDIYDSNGKFTQEGIDFINAVWPNNGLSVGDTYSQLEAKFANEWVWDPDNNIYIFPCTAINPNINPSILVPLTKIDYYYLEDATPQEGAFLGLTWLQDKRLKYLSYNFNLPSTDTHYNSDLVNTWHDYSCAVYGTLSGAVWSMKRYEVLPIVYWDTNVNSFCWQLNGIPTGITCQGVKGDKGEDSVVWVCKGIRYINDASYGDRVYAIEFLSCSDPSKNNISQIEEGDMLMIWYEIDNGTKPSSLPTTVGTITNFNLGLAKVINSEIYLDYSNNTDILQIFDNIELRNLLDHIKYTGVNPGTGMNMLYVPDSSLTNVFGIGWDSTDIDIHIGKADCNETFGDTAPESITWANVNEIHHNRIISTEDIECENSAKVNYNNDYINIDPSNNRIETYNDDPILTAIYYDTDSKKTIFGGGAASVEEYKSFKTWPQFTNLDPSVVNISDSLAVVFNPELKYEYSGTDVTGLYLPFPQIAFVKGIKYSYGDSLVHCSSSMTNNMIIYEPSQLHGLWADIDYHEDDYLYLRYVSGNNWEFYPYSFSSPTPDIKLYENTYKIPNISLSLSINQYQGTIEEITNNNPTLEVTYNLNIDGMIYSMTVEIRKEIDTLKNIISDVRTVCFENTIGSNKYKHYGWKDANNSMYEFAVPISVANTGFIPPMWTADFKTITYNGDSSITYNYNKYENYNYYYRSSQDWIYSSSPTSNSITNHIYIVKSGTYKDNMPNINLTISQ